MTKQMMKAIALVIVAGALAAFSDKEPTVAYKCMVQMINYTGEKAYVVISLVDKEGNYEQTLYMQGDDDEWYSDLKDWWKFFKKSKTSIDGITGASIGNGERQIVVLNIPKSSLDAGYSLRFESAVENQEYYVTDAEVPLHTATLRNKVDGTGYIRYIRMLPAN